MERYWINIASREMFAEVLKLLSLDDFEKGAIDFYYESGKKSITFPPLYKTSSSEISGLSCDFTVYNRIKDTLGIG